MQKKEVIEKPKKRKGLLIVLGVIMIIIVILFSTRLYLAVNLLLGNDIIIKVGADKEELSLQHGESGNVKFSTYILTNPLCSAQCSSEFTDLGSDKIIDTDNFSLEPAISKTKEFMISAEKAKKGLDLYRFEVKCRGVNNFLCRTSEQEKKNNILFVLNYDLSDEEEKFKNESEIIISDIIRKSDYINFQSETLDSVINSIAFEKNYFANEMGSVIQDNAKLNQSASELKKLWETQEYAAVSDRLADTNASTDSLNLMMKNLNMTLHDNITLYNSLIDMLSASRQKLETLKKLNLTNETSKILDYEIINFNANIIEFSDSKKLAEKSEIARNISERILALNISAEENATSFSSQAIIKIPEKIILTWANYSEISVDFKEPVPECCAFGECKDCCIGCAGKNYPVIFIHGHSFNKKISAEYSLEAFQEIQSKMENEGYIDAGTILISETGKAWQDFNSPVSVRASYYFDIYKNPKESSVIQTKSDNIDSYALRLKDIIDVVKHKTGKDKVIIVSHSMGGLVSRKYIQIFGDSSIDRLILIAAPNHGIDDNIQRFCSILGESLECRDMDKNSLFINKISYADSIKIPVFNIIGTGCKMGNETGDGIVTKQSAYLENAENIEVNGSCDEIKFRFLHEEMLSPEKYPEVYDSIVQSIK
jgi:hypothetical protein